MAHKGETGVYGVIDKLNGKLITAGTKKECDDYKNSIAAREAIRESYDIIIEVLRKYIDTDDKYYSLIALWIIGTYFYKEFNSYPYLFFNAMRGSGKSRTLNLVTMLSKDGQVMASPTEAVLFRTTGVLGIDEFERVGSKDKAAVRELLNACYKKGIKIFRMKKKKILGQEEQVVDEFEPYRPIIMANIWGMDEVLSDRCITIILEKSDKPAIIMITEDFQENNYINKIKDSLVKCSLCSVVMKKNIYTLWNDYILERYKTTLTTYNTYNTYTTQTTQEEETTTKKIIKTIILDELFNKIHDSGIKGRNLELFLPIFFIADIINDKILDKIIETAKDITFEKTHEEEIESKDVMVFDFVSRLEPTSEYTQIKQLTMDFRNFIDVSGDWLNTKWFGRALTRLKLIIDKRRTSVGISVVLDVKKATEKFKMFKRE